MDIEKLMKREPQILYPVAEKNYVINEWNGKCETVRVTRVKTNEIEFEYTDGVRHRVSPEYFAEATIHNQAL